MASFVRRVTENWKLKTLALAIASLLWVVWSAEAVTSNWIPVPLQVQVGDARYRPVGAAARDVEVRFSGTGRDLLDVAVTRPPLVLSINEVPGPNAEYSLDPRMVQLPSQLAVSALEVRPRNVSLELERIDTRVVPVRPRMIDALEPGWMLLDTLLLEPVEVRLSGPIAQVSSITEVYTLPFEVTNADTVLRRSVALDTVGLGALEIGTTSVNVVGRVDRLVDRVISDVRIDVGAGMTVNPAIVEVRLRGPERAVRAIPAGSVRVVVPVDRPPAIGEDGLTVPLRAVGVREGITVTVVPARATVMAVAPPTDDLQGRDPGPPLDSVASPAADPDSAGVAAEEADDAEDARSDDSGITSGVEE